MKLIEVEKTITDNPFVDNLIYYSKFLALNSTIKDEKEALANETPETLKVGEIYISCVEGRTNYELFPTIPAEIIEKYIPQTSNLDVLAKSVSAVEAYLNSLSLYERTNTLNNLSKLAQTVYIDHYDIMTNYVKNLPDTWLEDNKVLYDKCKNGSATYTQLFEVLPIYTRKRILAQYLNNYNNSDIGSIASSLNKFNNYIQNRTDENINTELKNINKAMRNVFASHYEIMQERGYITKVSQNNWYDYLQTSDLYKACINESADYRSLFDAFPKDDLKESLLLIASEDDVENIINVGLDALLEYMDTLSNRVEAADKLNKDMRKKYIENYNHYVNTDIYYKCKFNTIDYYQLTKYIPFETLKMILNTEIDEYTNIKVYADNKQMLTSYLNSLPSDKCKEIKDAITKDMTSWYIDNVDERNNYYRTLIGLPPIMQDLDIEYNDTLLESQIDSVNKYKFGKKFINMIPQDIYPESHWYAPLYSYDNYDIAILTEYGILDAYVAECKSTMNSKRYMYLKYLGDNKLNLYTCRKALNFQLIGVPAIDNTSMKNKFMDKYAINRDYVLKTVYSDAYEFQSDYYNKFIIIFILVNTIMDILAGISKMLIDRDVFDSRCIRYLFESYGIPYYSEIPIKYQQAMLKNLNILIKYKSSTRNMIDICNLFGFSDIRVFGYYMLKERVVDSNTGEYIFKENNDISYDLDKLYVIDKSNGKYVDANGVKYSKLSKYRNYDRHKYLKTISVLNDDNSVSQKQIINNAAKVFILDKWESVPTVAKNNDTGEYEEVEGIAAETSYHFIPLLETDYFYKVKSYDENHYCYDESVDKYFSKINANTDEATLKFVKVPINESLTDYKNDDEYISSYDEITYNDQGNTWDGGLKHNDVRNEILEKDFNAVLTKYISIETVTEMTELAFQVSYFYNMLFDNLYSEDHLTLEIPYIKVGHKFRFMDVICYLFALMYYYNGIKDNIMYSPTQILYIKGYNFDEDLNKILDDTLAFTTKDSNGNSLSLADRENIFDINNAISKEEYDYREAFKNFRMKAFNLDVNIDELDAWLAQFQLSLDDFIVYDYDQAIEHGFNQVITLRNFYSLNNSFYQKDIFSEALLPTQYNNDIKYGFDYMLYAKEYINDISGTKHEYIIGKVVELHENGQIKEITLTNYNYNYYTKLIQYKNDKNIRIISKYMEILDGTKDHIFVMNNKQYVYNDGERYAIYHKYRKSGSNFILEDPDYYIYKDGSYYELITGSNYDDKIQNCIDILDVEDNIISSFDMNDFYIYKDGEYVKNPDAIYINTDDSDKHHFISIQKDKEVNPKDCYVLASDGSFVPLINTSLYNDNTCDITKCFIISESRTDYYDINANPRVYYQKVSDYYSENDYYIYPEDKYFKEENELVYIKDKNGEYVFCTDRYYTKTNGAFTQITDNKYFYTDNNNRKILKFGNYYIYKDGKYVLDPNNCYIIVERGGKKQYVLLKDIDKYDNEEVNASNCYILHSDGHFIPLIDTDFYRKQPDGTYKYDKEICYVRVNKETEYYDPSDNPRIYYEKLTDYYNETQYVIRKDLQYVKDPDGNFIPETDLVNPNNCYYLSKGSYLLVINHLCQFKDYENPLDIPYLLIRDENNDYDRYKFDVKPAVNYVDVFDKNGNMVGTFKLRNYYIFRDGVKYINGAWYSEKLKYYPDDSVRYVFNSDIDYITAISSTIKKVPRRVIDYVDIIDDDGNITDTFKLKDYYVEADDSIIAMYNTIKKSPRKIIDYVDITDDDNNVTNTFELKDYYVETDDNINQNLPDDENNSKYTNEYVPIIKYAETKSMIVVLNKAISESEKIENIYDEKYNPEKTDKIWDENDWFYQDPSYQDTDIGMNGENTWYYKKPGESSKQDEDEDKQQIGSGFYLSAETYIGDVEIEKGIKYYMAMDIETNFSGKLQISCDSDSSCTDTLCRIYDITAGIKFHVDQTFIANNVKHPKIKFLVYDFKNYPIDIGDYIVVSNIRFMKSFNNQYIPQDIPSYDKLQEIYKTNEAIYKYLVTMMQNCSDYDTYQIYKKLYDSMMTSEYNKEAFKLDNGTYAKTYTDFLQTRDSVLYEKLTYFLSLDEDTMHKEIADNIIEVTYAIDDCVDTYSYGYLYSYFPAVSANYIQQYISKIINFFKSWKVHLLGINTIYKFDDPLENTVKILEDQQYRNRRMEEDHVHIADSAFINPIDALDPAGHKYSEKYPDLVKFSHYQSDRVNINDRVRIIVRDANMLKYTDNYENIHLILNNDDIKSHIDENGNLIVSNNAGLSVSIPNDLIYHQDESQDAFGNQNIENINDDTMDIIGGNN